MTHAFSRLSRAGLAGLADALRSGRLAPPYARNGLVGFVPPEDLGEVVAALEELAREGMQPAHIAWALGLLVQERAAHQAIADRLELVWSPAELDQVDCRDTSVVVQELFRRATQSVLIVTYALDEGTKAEAIFCELARRMDAEPELAVRIIVNVMRPYRDNTPARALERAFAERLRDRVWPGERLPEVFFDPRSLEEEARHSVLHAKCVVVDRRLSFITSANFTEAAQLRNIEAGVLVSDKTLAERLVLQFDRLIEAEVLKSLRVGPAKAPAR